MTMMNPQARAAQHEDKQLCLKIAGDIVVSAIQSGKLTVTTEEINSFFSAIYQGVLQSVMK